jgi:ATP-dependent exoDNAse (exonuclease V) alpha subunit
VFSAQGMTVDQAVVLIDPLFDRHAIHVASSRARLATTLVVDRRAIDAQLGAERPVDRQHKAVSSTAAERQAFLAERLSRAQAKVSTLDVIDEHLARGRPSNQTLAPTAQLRRLREPGREL